MILQNPYKGFRVDHLDEISLFEKTKKKEIKKIDFSGDFVKIKIKQIGKICPDNLREWLKYFVKQRIKKVLIRCVNIEQAKKLDKCLRKMQAKLTVDNQTNQYVFLQVA